MIKQFARRLAIRAGWYAIEQLIPKLEGNPGIATNPATPLVTSATPAQAGSKAPTTLDVQIVELLVGATGGLALWQILALLDQSTINIQQSILRLMYENLIYQDQMRLYHVRPR